MPRILPRAAVLATLVFPLPLFAPVAPFALWPSPANAQLAGTLSGPKFVEAAGLSGLFEMEASTLALKKSQNPQVRAFAERMIHDHEIIMKDLKAATESADGQITIPGTLDAKHETTIERLNAATGADFDTLYVQVQTREHDAAVGIFAAFEKDGDQTTLKAFAAKTLPMLKQHLDAIKQLQIKT
ncbi:DUF4142 domain-containing protein [Aquabacter sp. CN5-332]|uniref:DUF4142 domain-containing protein n=1 Tax=Aquabacter sp. CN5-332 TaxID=3156608 RepID=UPI0032B45374